MSINRINNYVAPEPISPDNKEVSKTQINRVKRSGDKLEISAEAKKLQSSDSFVEIAKTEMSKIPDIRQTKVDEIKGKVATNFYEQQEVIAATAQKMASSPDLGAALSIQNQQAASASVDDIKKLSVVLNRVDRKYYDSNEILSVVAKGIIKDWQNNS